ncbi:MAG TPA: sugar phosphate isomerase/epimerase family protein [Verrucomicrobiae bacterium]|nr:sugar phosphate isomerase/epimerase family protein [Verrucomicrobiae bacterium]
MSMLHRRAFLKKLAAGTALGWIGGRSSEFLNAADSAAPLFHSIGVCTTPDKAVAVKAAGGQYIEPSVTGFLIPDKPDSAWDKNLAAAKASPLPVAACNGFLPGNLRSTGGTIHHDAILKWAEIAFRRAKQVGVDRIVFGSSGSRKLPDGFSKDQAKAQFVDLLRRLAPLAGQHDVVIVVEPLRREEDNFINTVLDGAWFVEQVNHPNIRLLADLYHLLCNGESPEDLRRVAPLLRHMHIAEKDGRTAPGVHGDDFRPFFAALRGTGYADRLSVEGKWEMDQLPKAFETIQVQARVGS